MAISTQHAAILAAPEAGGRLELWRGPARGVLDETTITGAWLPTSGAGWTDVTGTVSLASEVLAAHDGKGFTITLSIADEGRDVWVDDAALALVAQAWDGGAWSPRATVAWGYLDGSGDQELDAEGNQTGRRSATYQGYWARARVPAHRMGRHDLATGASVAGSTPALASVLTEAGVEYISQDSNAPGKAIDGNTDTVYIGDLIADPVVPTLGDTTVPRILRAYAGRTSRSIGAGNEPIFIELYYGHNLAGWGTTWTGIPQMYNYFAGEGLAAVRNDGTLQSSVVDYGSYKAFRVTLKQQPTNPNAQGWVQWIVMDSTYKNRPLRIHFDIRAGDGPSVGKSLQGWFTDAAPSGGERQDINPLVLAADWQSYDLDLASTGSYAGAKVNWQALRFQLHLAAITYELRNLRISVGYADEANGTSGRLFLSYDNGAGIGRTQRLAFDLGPSAWTIPAEGSVIVTDDVNTFRAKFDPGTRQVFQMKNLQPEWFFGPGVGKLALRFATDPNRLVYNPPSNVISTVDEIDFTTNGLTWLPYQGVSRQSPIGTGALTVEDYPHVGTFPGTYGGGFLWLDLKPFVAAKLTQPMDSVQTFFVVDDPDRVVPGQEVVIGSERLWVSTRTGDSFACARAQGGTTPAAHAVDDAVTPRIAGATQTGPQWDAVTLRRKPGTPAIRSGVIIASNLASPGDPSAGGAKWERHPDWFLITRFENPAQASSLNLRVPGGMVQARHVCVGDVLMHRRNGVAQRWKLNEIGVPERLPGGITAGGYSGHSMTNEAETAAHILIEHGDVPAAKLTVNVSPAPMGDLPIAAATVRGILDNLSNSAGLVIWLDGLNNVIIGPDPANPQYDAREAYATLTPSLLLAAPSGQWAVPRPVAQVKVTARETASLRTYVATYPDVPGTLGEIVEIKGVNVNSWGDARDRAEREFRARNVRRTPQRVTVNAAPWAAPWLRLIYAVPALDGSGAWSGVNVAIVGFTHHFVRDETNGIQWTTDLVLREVVL